MNENNTQNSRNTFGFVGLGLIGGSIARAIRKYIPEARILAFTPHPETVREAINDGVADEYVPAVGKGFSDCDVVFLCAPVELNAENLQMLKSCIKPGAVVIDVGFNVDGEGNLCGDVDFESIRDVAEAATPVPGGVGGATTAILAEHLVKAAKTCFSENYCVK